MARNSRALALEAWNADHNGIGDDSHYNSVAIPVLSEDRNLGAGLQWVCVREILLPQHHPEGKYLQLISKTHKAWLTWSCSRAE